MDRLNDDPSADVALVSSQSDAAGTQDTDSPSPPASSPPTPAPDDQWETNNGLHRAGAKLKRFCKWEPPDALDRVVILRSTADADSVLIALIMFL